MKAGTRNIILIIVSVVMAVILAPFIMKLAEKVIEVLVIIALAYIFFRFTRQLMK